jgi:hypothetical protein
MRPFATLFFQPRGRRKGVRMNARDILKNKGPAATAQTETLQRIAG